VPKTGKTIRVGIFTLSFPTPSETFIVTKVLGLLRAGIDVHIFTLTPSAHWDRFAVLASWPDIQQRIHCAPATRPLWKMLTQGSGQLMRKALAHPVAFLRFLVHNWRTRKENYIGFWKGLFRRLPFIGESLDVLHVEFDAQGLGTADLKSFLKCPLLLSSRGAFQRTSVPDRFPRVYDYLFRYVDGYHFISRYLRTNTYRLGLNPFVRTWLIEPAIDLDLFVPNPDRPLRAPGAPYRILSVGRLDWAKGYEFALDAVARVRDAGIPVEYTILGEGQYEEALIFAARQNNLLQSGVVRFMGAVPRESVLKFYLEADVMLHPALEEGFCNAVIEAQAMELPIVASDAGGLPENVEDEVTGFVVPRRDSGAMAQRLIQLARDPELCRQLGRAGREHVRRHFDISSQVGEFVSLYESLAGSHPERSA
jgi:colanic acid/amylovoran biosynthesis glycosyltransferase